MDLCKRYRQTKTFKGLLTNEALNLPSKPDSEEKQICTPMKYSMALTRTKEYRKMRMDIFGRFRVTVVTDSPSVRTQMSQEASGVGLCLDSGPGVRPPEWRGQKTV